jgi:hypothetical protein
MTSYVAPFREACTIIYALAPVPLVPLSFIKRRRFASWLAWYVLLTTYW